MFDGGEIKVSMICEDEYVTKAGLAKMGQMIRDLEDELAKIRREKGEAALTGGNVWHDNFSFEQLEREERMLLSRLGKLKKRYERAKIISPPQTTKKVEVGSTVEVVFKGGEVKRFTILGSTESDPESGTISEKSPLGAVLLGATKGEVRSYKVLNQTFKVKVRKIEVREFNDKK